MFLMHQLNHFRDKAEKYYIEVFRFRQGIKEKNDVEIAHSKHVYEFKESGTLVR